MDALDMQIIGRAVREGVDTGERRCYRIDATGARDVGEAVAYALELQGYRIMRSNGDKNEPNK